MLHTKTENALKGIEEILKAIRAEKDRAGEELKKVNELDREMYVEGYIEKKRAAIKSNFAEYCQPRAATLEALAKSAMEAERELEALPIDVNNTALTNALALVNSMGDALPVEQQEEIAKQFSGDYAAEKTLQALYSKLNLPYLIRLTSGEALTGELYGAIAEFNYDTEKTERSFRSVERIANIILEKFNSSYRMDIGVKMGAFMEYIHAGAGLEMKH